MHAHVLWGPAHVQIHTYRCTNKSIQVIISRIFLWISSVLSFIPPECEHDNSCYHHIPLTWWVYWGPCSSLTAEDSTPVKTTASALKAESKAPSSRRQPLPQLSLLSLFLLALDPFFHIPPPVFRFPPPLPSFQFKGVWSNRKKDRETMGS